MLLNIFPILDIVAKNAKDRSQVSKIKRMFPTNMRSLYVRGINLL